MASNRPGDAQSPSSCCRLLDLGANGGARLKLFEFAANCSFRCNSISPSLTLEAAGPQGKLRAKLTEKTRNRPYELVRKRMPAGTKELAAVPMLAASSRKAATAEQVQKYEEKIRSASSTFSSHHLDEGTLEEHDNY